MISIALASYNGEKYIREQLYSILNQTIQDFEVIICDDCSNDNTWNIIEEYANNDARFRCYKNDENLGLIKNFEKAISLCEGEYVALCDQDDIWLLNHLEELLRIIGDKAIACANAELIDAEGKLLNITLDKIEGLHTEVNNDIDRAFRVIFYANPFQGASMLIRKDFFEVALPIPESVKYHDAWFAALSCFSGGLNYSREIIILYRQHQTNVTVNYKKNWRNFIRYFTRQKKCLSDRLEMVTYIKNRVPQLSEEKNIFLAKAIQYFTRKNKFHYKLQNAFYRFSNYELIYSTKSKKYFFPRLIKYFFT